MDLDKFKYIVCIAEEKSFTKAAQKLYISQPALSQYVATIEDQFKTKFFDRSCNPLKLTPAGEIFIKKALEIINLKKELWRDLEDSSNNKIVTFSIGISPNRSPYILPLFIPQLKKDFPNIKIKLLEKTGVDLENALINNQIDIAIISLPLLEKSLVYEEFFKEELLLITPNEERYQYFNRKKVKLENLKDENFILLQERQKLRTAIEAFFLEKNFNPKIFLETENQECVLSLISSGLGIGFASNMHLTNKKWRDHFLTFSLDETILSRKFVIAYKKDKKLSKVENKLIEILRK